MLAITAKQVATITTNTRGPEGTVTQLLGLKQGGKILGISKHADGAISAVLDAAFNLGPATAAPGIHQITVSRKNPGDSAALTTLFLAQTNNHFPLVAETMELAVQELKLAIKHPETKPGPISGMSGEEMALGTRMTPGAKTAILRALPELAK